MTRHKVVSNAGPLIYLAVLGRFSLLQELFSEIYIPVAVYEEVAIQGAGQPGADETSAAVKDGWLKRVGVNNRVAVDALLGDLDLGESESIVLARQLSVNRILLDDRAARTKAGLMGLTVTGTIGVLLFARQAGVEIDLKHDLNLLIQHNFRISGTWYQTLTGA